MKQDRIVIIVIFFIAIAISLMPRESIKAANRKPAISVTQSSKSSITISWPSSKNKYYTVQMKAGNKNYKTIRRYTKGMKSYKATKLVAGQTYSFRVKSYKMSKGSKLYSSYSKVKKVTLSKSTSISSGTPRTLLTKQEISTKYQDSGVMIHTYYSNGIACATGSGFVIDYKDTKYIVTAAHVIKGVYSKETGTYSAGPYIVMIIFNNGITMYCTTIYNIDFEADIAILIPDNPQDIVCNGIPLADSDAVIEGENCITITSPYGLGNIMNSVTCGKISGICEDRGVKKIQFTAQTYNGSSGGVLLNMFGEAIGVVTEKLNDTALSYGSVINNITRLLSVPMNRLIYEVSGYYLPGTSVPAPIYNFYETVSISFDSTITSFYYSILDVLKYSQYLQSYGFQFIGTDSISLQGLDALPCEIFQFGTLRVLVVVIKDGGYVIVSY